MQPYSHYIDLITEMSGVNTRQCMMCGKCSGSCPAYDDMDIRPHQFVALVDRGDIKTLMNAKGVWNCMSCFACVERCPRNVEPAKLIEAVRVCMMRLQNQNLIRPQDIPPLLNSEMPQQALVSAFRKYSR
jgi:heterodisulfide reductase subunit C